MTKDELKEYFKQGKIPTESNFSELIDFSTYSHKRISLGNTEEWINFINNYIVNNREKYGNGLTSGDIIDGYTFIINGRSDITFYIDRTIYFINCTFLIGSLENKILNFKNCKSYNCVIDNGSATITGGDYSYCYITSYGNISDIISIINSKIVFNKSICTLSVKYSINNSYIKNGIITASEIGSSIITASCVTGSIKDSSCVIKNARIDNLNFKSNANWIELINCYSHATVTSLFKNSDITSISGNIYSCDFGNITDIGIVLKGVRSCKLNSVTISANKYFADTFGNKNASEYGENSIIN